MWKFSVVAACLAVLAGCGGGGDTASGGGSQPAPTSVTISGRATFDLVPFSATTDGGLDFARATAAPIRGATVEIVAGSGGSVLASGVTDSSGNYSLSVAPNTDVFVRVKAEMVRAGSPSWNFSVRDNTNVDSLYALDGSVFNTGAAAVTRNLHAASGWSGGSYTSARAAAPFSVLDAAYQAFQLVLSVSANQNFPQLRLMWSRNNRPVEPVGSDPASIAAQIAQGNIGTTYFATGTPARIYILGDASVDTDEFDQHVIAHEWGHYYQAAFSRDDSPGGEHSGNQRQDFRLAFSEGWGNAFSAMVKGDPLYRDSFVQSAAQRDFSINVESNSSLFPGTYNETSVQSYLYDVFDAVNDGADTISLGFGPIHAAMSGTMRSTPALTTLYPMISALRDANASQAAALDALAQSQQMVPVTDAFGANETNNGGDARNLPIHRLVGNGQTVQVCSTVANGTFNRLGNRKFLRFDLPAAGTLTARATNGPNGSDPDLALYASGAARGLAEGTASGTETLTVSGLSAGTYIVEVYEFSNLGNAPRGDTCFDLQLSAS